MSQWRKIDWHKLAAEGKLDAIGEIRIHPHEEGGKKTAKSSHPHVHPFHELDWHSEDAQSEGAAHLHDGVVDHVRVVPVDRRQGVSVHALWHDKDGNVVRRDAHFHAR